MAFNKKNPTDVIKIRPQFKLYSGLNERLLSLHLLSHIEKDDTIYGRKKLNRVHFSAPPNELHYWSPELHVIVEKSDFKDGACLTCMLGPQQNVWITFVAVYTVIGLLTFFGGMFALVKLQLGNPSLWLLLFPLEFMLVLGVYLISYFGKKKGHEQSIRLLRFLYGAIDDAEIIRR